MRVSVPSASDRHYTNFPALWEESKLLASHLDLSRADLTRITIARKRTRCWDIGLRSSLLSDITEMQGRADFRSAVRAMRRHQCKPEIIVPLYHAEEFDTSYDSRRCRKRCGRHGERVRT